MDGFYDVIVVGGGVVGCHCARELSRYDLRILLLEKEADVCSGASKANSGIVHAALSPRPGTWKAKLCLEGKNMMRQVCEELSVPFAAIGSLTVALDEREVRVLLALRARAERNGERDLELLTGEELKRLEPALNPGAVAALYAPSAGIVDPMLLTIAAAENAAQNGAQILLEAEVQEILVRNGRVVGVVTPKGEFGCRFLVNAAGTYADEIMRLAGMDPPPLRPRRGDYYVLDKMELVRHVIFPIPTRFSKGILVTPTVHGNVLLGPTSVPTAERERPPVEVIGLEEVAAQAKRLVPAIDIKQSIAVYAGLRPSGYDDFRIQLERSPAGMLSLAGIESPGLTAAPAIARLAVRLLSQAGLELRPRLSFEPYRPAPPRVAVLSPAERAELAERDCRYGRVICRCEQVTEGEIVRAIHGLVPARTLDALKKRLRVMSGRCQGAFDLPLLVEILSRELGVAPWEVTKEGPGSEVIVGPSRPEPQLQEGQACVS